MTPARENELEGLARSMAVEEVDGRYGYTVEFSNQPSVHRAEYDEAENRHRCVLGLPPLDGQS